MVPGCTAINLVRSTKIKEPEIKYVDHTMGDPDLKKVPFYLHFTAHNPNEIGLKNVFLEYELYAEGKRFLKGSNVAIVLAPKADTQIVVPAEVIYRDVFSAVGPVAERVLTGSKTLPVLAKVTIRGDPTIYNEIEEGALFYFTYGFSKTVEVPIPQDKVNEAKDKIKDGLGQIKKKYF